ncbi:MAG: hypothetical protein ACRDJU_13575 [Actinomycetota bacterium]
MKTERGDAVPAPTPGELSALWASASITEFAYLTPKGEPLCWPVTPYWYPERGVLGIATGLAYPNKAYCARRHPQVAAMVGDTVLQGDAAVLDDDLQANTDRYIREMRRRFFSARIGLNPISMPFLDFYLPRIWIEVTPQRVMAQDAMVGLVAGQAPAGGGPAGGGPAGAVASAPSADIRALQRWVVRRRSAVITLAGPDGYPVMARTKVWPGPGGSVMIDRSPGTGPAALTLHCEGLGGVRLDAVMARGWVTSAAGGYRFVARHVVGFFGRRPDARPAFGSIFPLSQLPRAGDFRGVLTRELSRRGEPLPRMRVPR